MFLADASFIVSPFAKTPTRRKWAQTFFEKHRGRLWTTAAAFTEAGYLIGDPTVTAKILPDYHFFVELEAEKKQVMKPAPHIKKITARRLSSVVRPRFLRPSRMAAGQKNDQGSISKGNNSTNQ